MMADEIKRTVSDFPALGDQIVKTCRGDVLTIDVPGLSCGRTIRPDGSGSITVLLYDPEPEPETGVGMGMICQLSPEAARAIAASLLEQADKVEPMVKN